MLLEFRVENFRSICDEQVFTMEAGSGRDDDPRPRDIEGLNRRVLTVAGVYGANASGKSNFLSAIGSMRDAVVHSHRSWPPDGGVPRDPFAWGGRVAEPSLFEATLVLRGVRYQYGFVVDDTQVVEEWIYAWPLGRQQTWLQREGSDFRFGEHLGGENRVVEKVTRPNALFLSAAAQHGHPGLSPLFSWFRAIREANTAFRRRIPMSGFVPPDRWLARLVDTELDSVQQDLLFDDGPRPEEVYSSFRELLRRADVGIVDLKFEERDPEGDEGSSWRRRPRVMVRHNVTSGDGWLPIEQESQGTLALVQLGPMLLNALRRGTLVVVDELEASLHPLLAVQILQLFNKRETNPLNAQLVFSTHDTNLLGSVIDPPPLRRDQVWLTEKNGQGATVLYPLTDYKPRKHENLERGYLQGRYGAIPYLGDLASQVEPDGE